MEYNINLPANLSPKEWKATANAAKTKAKSKRDRKRAQITNSKKLKMYRKNKWNWMVQRWTVKRQRKRNDALIKCFCLFWLVLWLFCFSRFALQPQHHFEMYGSGNLRCASVTWQAIRKTMLTSHISVPEPTTKTMRRKIRTRIAEKSRKLIGEILFMANSKCERIYNLVGCVALTTHLSIWWASDREKQIANELTSIGVHANFGTGFTVIMKLPGRSHHRINAISLSSRLSAKINYNDDKVSRKLSAGVFRMQCEKNIS